MDAAWIEALTELWKNDEEIDFLTLEKDHQLRALERCGAEPASPNDATTAGRQSLLICLTGFGEQRDQIAAKITANGGRYTGDLTRRCTHLVVSKPEGKKFTAAKSWKVYTVTLGWLDQSIERGLILDEDKFDPLLPVEEQGVGAWKKEDPRRSSLGKRSRSSASNSTDERGARKLRKTASMKLNSQRNNLWGDILGRSGSREDSFGNDQAASEQLQQAPQQATPEPTIRQPHQHQQLPSHQDDGVFANCVFAIHGFNEKRQTVLEDTIATLGGFVASSLREVATPRTQMEEAHRFLVVPQTSHPDSHPEMQYDNVEVVTEFYIERCLHNKQFFSPGEHVLGRPFPLFPIPGFSGLVVCSAAFTGLELNQVARSITQLGATFEEEFRRTTSVLVCRSLKAMRKEKLKYALEWGVPVVTADWLWECISAGFNAPMRDYIHPEIRDRYPTQPALAVADKKSQPQPSKAQGDATQPTATPIPTATKPASSKPKLIGGFDVSAFEDDSPENPIVTAKNPPPERGRARHELTTSADFFTARSQPLHTSSKEPDAPLAEVSCARLNKSPSPPKHTVHHPARTKSDPYPRVLTEKPSTSAQGTSSPPPEKPPLRRDSHESNTAKHEETESTAKQQAKAAERQAFTSKLSSLIDSAAGPPADCESGRTQAPPRPRRRQLLGRAISNASNGSSAASIDGSGPPPRQVTDSLRAAVATATNDDDDYHLDKDSQPPSTQLQYADPEAQQVKAALMNKMMGREEPKLTTSHNGGISLRAKSLRKR